MKKKILGILMAGIIVATMFGAMSVGATILNNKQDVKPLPLDMGGTGDIGAVVFYEELDETDEVILKFITDATVYCIDVNGYMHCMEYGERGPGKYFYLAHDVPEGPCEITASKEGFSEETASGVVEANEFRAFRIKLIDESKSHPAFTRLIDLFRNAFPILRFLLRL